MQTHRSFSLALARVTLVLAVVACSAPIREPVRAHTASVAVWGTMREVLRDGDSRARVAPLEVAHHSSVGVGALANLAGEVTILDGRVLVAEAVGPLGPDGVPATMHVREATPDDRAALLVVADVPAWEEHALTACANYAELDAAIAGVLRAQGRDPLEPIPVRVRGARGQLELHVIAGACPIASPTGAPPWRHAGPFESVEIVGIFADESAGRLTHHVHRSHLHAVVGDVMGHLDEVALADGAVLMLPAR